MYKNSILISILVLTSIFITSCNSSTKNDSSKKLSSVKYIGAMKNVMHKGQLYGTIDLDTISNKQHLYGLGPVEFLTGELTILDGKSYKSTVVSDSSMKVEETFKAKAPFFVYANVEKWNEQALPDSVQTMKQLENYLDQTTKNNKRPFAFKLTGTFDTAVVHIMNLPTGTKVSSPDDAKKGQRKYTLHSETAEIIGFFSTEHAGIFTHHDSFVHMHLICNDKTKMGHLDEVTFNKGTKLYLPN